MPLSKKTPPPKKCAFVSFRLGSSKQVKQGRVDGVSIVTELWQEMFESFGLQTYRVAGAGTADYILPLLAIEAAADLEGANSVRLKKQLRKDLEKALAPADLVVVENLCSIPLNVPAGEITAEVLQNRPAVFHHHDPPLISSLPQPASPLSSRHPAPEQINLPLKIQKIKSPTNQSWRNVVISRLAQKQMAEQDVEAVCIYNPFRTKGFKTGSRKRTRKKLGLSDDELLVVHPARATPAKNIAGAIQITEKLGGVYWLTGAAESFQNYEPEVTALMKKASCKTIWKQSKSAADIYTAGDLVVFPSFREGFGMPPVEASIYGRHCVVGDYPVADELMSLGIKWFRQDELDEVRMLLENGGDNKQSRKILKQNQKVIEENFSIEVIGAQLKKVVDSLNL